MTPWSVPRMWEGGSCWIIGGGTSVLRLIGEDVLSRTDFLSNKHVIGINVAYRLPCVSVCYFGDRSFFQNNYKNLKEYSGLKVTHCVLPKRYLKHADGIKHLRMRGEEGLTTNPKEIRWNKSSGAAAINLATLMGVNRIFLLGFDMKGCEGKTHWHNKYGKYRIHQQRFEGYLTRFDGIAEDAKNQGVEILNVNDDSAITSFRQISLNEALNYEKTTMAEDNPRRG